MAEEVKQEVKQEEKKTDVKKMMSTLFKVLLGLVFLALGVLAIMRWFHPLLILVKGGIGLFLIMAGLITLAIAKE
jgi:fatty acid desaturase